MAILGHSCLGAKAVIARRIASRTAHCPRATMSYEMRLPANERDSGKRTPKRARVTTWRGSPRPSRLGRVHARRVAAPDRPRGEAIGATRFDVRARARRACVLKDRQHVPNRGYHVRPRSQADEIRELRIILETAACTRASSTVRRRPDRRRPALAWRTTSPTLSDRPILSSTRQTRRSTSGS